MLIGTGIEQMRKSTIDFKFDEKKATQAAGWLLEKSCGKMNHMKLLKLLYLVDRAALGRWSRPITGDQPYSLPYGPVLSKTYEMIKGRCLDADYWRFHISETQDFTVEIRESCGDDALTQAECDLIDDVFEEFGSKDQYELVEYCHDECSEWNDPGETSKVISFESILEALGKDQEEIEEKRKDIAASNWLDAILDEAISSR